MELTIVGRRQPAQMDGWMNGGRDGDYIITQSLDLDWLTVCWLEAADVRYRSPRSYCTDLFMRFRSLHNHGTGCYQQPTPQSLLTAGPLATSEVSECTLGIWRMPFSLYSTTTKYSCIISPKPPQRRRATLVFVVTLRGWRACQVRVLDIYLVDKLCFFIIAKTVPLSC